MAKLKRMWNECKVFFHMQKFNVSDGRKKIGGTVGWGTNGNYASDKAELIETRLASDVHFLPLRFFSSALFFHLIVCLSMRKKAVRNSSSLEIC